MIKIPSSPPDWKKIIREDPHTLIKLPREKEVQQLIEKANRRYDDWDKVRCQPLPKEFNKEQVWACLRFLRKTGAKNLPIKDKEGRPFSFWLSDEILKNLHLIDQNTGGSIGITDPRSDGKNSQKYIVHSLMEEAITSSQIEGAVATIKEAKKMLLTKRKPRDRSEQMIFNNYQTMHSIKKVCDKKLSQELLLDLHALITRNTLDHNDEEGRYRLASETVNVETYDGEILFTPPRAEEIPDRLKALCHFANDEKDPFFIHPVIKAIILHFWLAYIHPFTDGNGRMARTIFYWYLIRHGYWLFEYISISSIILKKQTQYAQAYLKSEIDDGDLTYFLAFHIRVIMEAIKDLEKYLEKQRDKDKALKRKILKFPELNLRQIQILEKALSYPDEIFTINAHKESNRLSYETARKDLLDLSEKRLLLSTKKGKTFYFTAPEDLREKIAHFS